MVPRPYLLRRSSGIEVGADQSPNVSEESAPRKEQDEARLVALVKRVGRRGRSGPEQGEAHLVRLATGGDKQAIAELYRRHVDMIYRYTYARVHDVSVAEDLTAQVFLKALEGLDTYRPTGVPFRAWLYRIAHARTIDHWRQQARHREVLLVDTMPATDPSPEDVMIAKSQWQTAVGLLGELTDEQRDVVIMRFFEDMSLADIAEALGKTIGAVKALQHRALASLARLLKERTALASD
jgi:RNA polymerase sigma-70 factor, ECF subfamily